MKFQDSSFNSLKVTVGTKSVTHARTHAPKAICPINFFKVGGIMTLGIQAFSMRKIYHYIQVPYTRRISTIVYSST